jgi:hypothetical protein
MENWYINGKITRLEKMEKIRPPITAVPKGDVWSPPSPKPKAIGTIPAIIAKLVIRIGLIRSLIPCK